MDVNLILYLMIGLMIARRTIDLLKHINVVAIENERWLRSLYLITPIMLLLLMRIGHTKLFWVCALVCFCLPIFVTEFIERRRTRLFVSETAEFYDELVFELRSGNSLRSSLDRIKSSARFGFYTREMVGVALKNDGDEVMATDMKAASRASFRNKLTAGRVLELRRLIHSSGKILDRLQFIRHVHGLEQKFVRKSRIATRQVRAQAMIVLLLYVGLLALQLSSGFTKINSVYVFLSLSLILVGLGTIFHIMRSFKWKV